MTLLGQPGITARDLIEVYPVVREPHPDGEEWGYLWRAGEPVEVFSQKLSARERFQSGKANVSFAYRIFANASETTHEGFTEKGRLWHPDVGNKTEDGTLDLDQRLLNVTGNLPRGDLVIIEAEFTEQER